MLNSYTLWVVDKDNIVMLFHAAKQFEGTVFGGKFPFAPIINSLKETGGIYGFNR